MPKVHSTAGATTYPSRNKRGSRADSSSYPLVSLRQHPLPHHSAGTLAPLPTNRPHGTPTTAWPPVQPSPFATTPTDLEHGYRSLGPPRTPTMPTMTAVTSSHPPTCLPPALQPRLPWPHVTAPVSPSYADNPSAPHPPCSPDTPACDNVPPLTPTAIW